MIAIAQPARAPENPLLGGCYVFPVRTTDQPISCARPPHAEAAAARPLPRLTIASAEASCNGRDAMRITPAKGLQPRTSVRPRVSCIGKLGGALARRCQTERRDIEFEAYATGW